MQLHRCFFKLMQGLANAPLRTALESAAEQMGDAESVEVDDIEAIEWHGLVWGILEKRMLHHPYNPEQVIAPYTDDGLRLTVEGPYIMEHVLHPVADRAYNGVHPLLS